MLLNMQILSLSLELGSVSSPRLSSYVMAQERNDALPPAFCSQARSLGPPAWCPSTTTPNSVSILTHNHGGGHSSSLSSDSEGQGQGSIHH